MLYGTTSGGGSNGFGTVFSVTTIRRFLRSLFSFANSNGASPNSTLTFGPYGALYGTTSGGGDNITGTVFQMPRQVRSKSLYSFGTTNQQPNSQLLLGLDGNFYGTTARGPQSFAYGTIYRISPAGAFQQVMAFDPNTTGSSPGNWLVLGGYGEMYGTTGNGSSNGFGCIYRLTTSGTFKVINAFDTTTGVRPVAGLTRGPNSRFYGTAGGGTNSDGTCYVFATNGLFQSIASFYGPVSGSQPIGGLVLGSDQKLYGLTAYNGWRRELRRILSGGHQRPDRKGNCFDG